MWLQDLEKALARLKEECDYNFICVESITPAADGGIVFKTTYNTYIKWFPNGEIRERNKEDWRSTLANNKPRTIHKSVLNKFREEAKN